MKYLICGYIGKAKDLKIDNFIVKGKVSLKGGNKNGKKRIYTNNSANS